MEHALSTGVMFGWNPMWVAGILFVLTYLVILSERINRAIVSLLAAGLMILSGVLSQNDALRGVDFNTLGLLAGMMVIVAITRRTGVFQFLAIWSVKRVNANPWGILVVLTLVTTILSALLDNVTTVLLIVPVTLLICEELKVNPYPFLFSEILGSNIGGTSNLIGDPPNIMIGSSANLGFNDFLINLGPAIVVIALATMAVIYAVWGRSLHADHEDRQRVLNYNEWEAITDWRLLWKCLSVLALVIGGFVLGHQYHLQPATSAMTGAALLLLLDNLARNADEQSQSVHASFSEVEWVTLFFFLGLFIVVHAVETTGLLNLIAHAILNMTGGNSLVTSVAILWGSAFTSALVDNIPYVATTIPLIKSMAPTFGGAAGLMPLWWSLALGACLGGNGTLIGASANVVVAGFAERSGYPITFKRFLLGAFPLMLLSILISNIYIYLRYF
jgi:Na+/H+ antiporter NhaD/arsenite permease-like protein